MILPWRIIPRVIIGGIFYGKIVVDSSTKWNREWFINVIVHELSHSVGLPHVPEGESEMMMPAGFDCGKNRGKDKICKLRKNDFEAFLEPYGPAITRSALNQYNRRQLDIVNGDSTCWIDGTVKGFAHVFCL